MKDYPQGDGQASCEHCHGRGVIPVPQERRPKFAVGEWTEVCPCVLVRDVMLNIERGWKGLTKATPLQGESPLKAVTSKSRWVTAPTSVFRQHLRHVASRMGPKWDFMVVSDADLMDAWLSYGIDVYDADVEAKRRSNVKDKYAALVDLVEPPELLILHLGVKAARNSAMPEVLLEALRHRDHIDKVTWVVDQPGYPIADGHISFDLHVQDFLSEWPRLKLEGTPEVSTSVRTKTQPPPNQMSASSRPPRGKSLLTSGDAARKDPFKKKKKKNGFGDSQ